MKRFRSMWEVIKQYSGAYGEIPHSFRRELMALQAWGMSQMQYNTGKWKRLLRAR